MHILMVTTRPYPFGGKEQHIHMLQKLLEGHGHTTEYFAIFTESELTPSSDSVRQRLSQVLAKQHYDVIHFHALEEPFADCVTLAAQHGAKLVATAHDFSLICPIGMCLIKQRVCLKCTQGRYYHAVLCRFHIKLSGLMQRLKARKAQSSEQASTAKAKTVPSVSLWQRLKRQGYISYIFGPLWLYLSETLLKREPWHNDLFSTFIMPSDFMLNTFKKAGFKYPMQRIHNFMCMEEFEPDKLRLEAEPDSSKSAEPFIIYAGRLDLNKGIMTLLKAVRGTNILLKIAGTGNLRPQIEELLAQDKQYSNVTLEGFLPRPKLLGLISKARLAVVPSEWWEPFGYSALEPLALGRPVVYASSGALPEIVPDNAGRAFTPGNAGELRQVLEELLSTPAKLEAMGENGRAFALKSFNAEGYYQRLITCYGPETKP